MRLLVSNGHNVGFDSVFTALLTWRDKRADDTDHRADEKRQNFRESIHDNMKLVRLVATEKPRSTGASK